MATAIQAAALPETEKIVTEQVLMSRQYSSLILSRGFAGESDPSVIWSLMVRDDPRSFLFYRELEDKDSDIGSYLEQLKLSVLMRPRAVTPADDSQEALVVSQFIQDQLDSLPSLYAVLEALLDAPGYGIAISELTWDVSEGQVALLDAQDCPQELFAFNKRFEPQIGPLRFMPNIYDVDGIPVPENKFVIFSYRPRNRNRLGRPMLKHTFWPSWIKRQVLRMWLRFGEKGPGTAAVQYAQGATEDERNQALEAAEAIVERVAVAVPENFSLVKELLTGARAQNPAVYKDLHAKMDSTIARRITGSTLTVMGSDGGAGSYAQAKVHQGVSEARQKEIGKALVEVINKQIVRPLVLWNFGPDAPMPTWNIDLDDEDDLAQRVEIDSTLQKMGVPIPKSYALERYAIPAVEAKDEVLEPTAGGAPGLGAPIAAAYQAVGRSAFSDATEKKEIDDFERLFAQLRKESLAASSARIKQIVRATSGGGK